MRRTRRLALALIWAGALTVGSAGAGLAADDPPFGQLVAMCAQESLGQRTNPPAVTCAHDGTPMTFPNFGAMVQHMREHHG